MRLTIFGATGGVGQHVVTQALAQGHEVVAHTRSPEKFKYSHQNLFVVQGDVLDYDTVRHAIEGSDAVLCTLGMPIMNKDGLRAKGTKTIIRAMEELNVKRFVCLSGLGAGDSFQLLPTLYRYVIFPLILRHVFADHNVQESYVKNSSLDWILARPSNFSKKPISGTYKQGLTQKDPSLKLKIPQSDVADFLLQQIDSDTYLHATPGISY